MPATSSGRIVKTRKVKKGTAHNKNHRWESFTTKISKLNSLDPIRKVRRHDIEAEDLSLTTSYFKAGLEKWQELNLCEGFIAFSCEVHPLCDSLPQILHFEDKIMGLLGTYIEMKENNSLQPLLAIVTDFARDLGARFEKHYAKALGLLTSLAGTPQDVEVIEWTFTSLAFLFKYLSKLVVPDIRPTYDTMAPILGKKRQPPHIARFAAEALSFLIKKAGAPAHREKALPLIVGHIKKDLKSILGTREFGLYYHGIMTLFAEAMKGNGLSIHTAGPAIFQALFTAVEDDDFDSKKPSPWMDVIYGVETSIIHHSNSDNFKDIQEVIFAQVNAAVDAFAVSASRSGFCHLLLCSRIIGIMAGVRMSSRISDWPSLLKSISNILSVISQTAASVNSYDPIDVLWKSLISSVSIVLQYTPIDAVFPFISKILDCLIKEPLAQWFLTFCSYFSQANSDRYSSLVLPYFQRFVVAHWSDADNEDTLCVLLPKMVATGVFQYRHGKGGFTLPQPWQDQIVSKFECLELSPFPEQASSATADRSPRTWHDRCLPKYNALLEVLECTAVHPSTSGRIAEILLRKLKLALRPSSSLAPEEANFIVGRGFSAYCRMSKAAGEIDGTLKALLHAAAPRYSRLPTFLEAMLAYETYLRSSTKSRSSETGPSPKPASSNDELDLLAESLVTNLSSGSHDLRLLSLRLLELFYNSDHDKASEAIPLMIMIEQTPLDLQSGRIASMHIRKLAILYNRECSNPRLRHAIPSFCFGMLTVKLAQIWEDAILAITQIAESKLGDEAIAELLFEWLETPSPPWTGSAKPVEGHVNRGMTDFECLNLMRLDKLAKDAELEVINARDTMSQRFTDAQELLQPQPSTARAQAFRVLSSVPHIAEKRSRQLVPMFLSWARKEEELSQSLEDEESNASNWTRKEQKALLEVFGKLRNPKALYKSAEVHEATLNLLSNGDIDMQKLAFKAILTWKDPNVRPYEENLLNLLDEARFKDEIAVLFHGETLIQVEHRSRLMPILLRLLYGRTISRKGVGSGKQGMEARRLTVLRNLDIDDIGQFLDIALGDLKEVHLTVDGIVQSSAFDKEIISVRKQVGFTHMIEGVLKELGANATPFGSKLLEPVLYCLVFASRRVNNQTKVTEDEGMHQTSMLKTIRQTALKCMINLFSVASQSEWAPHIDTFVGEVISPRLELLPTETGQGVSGILRLFSTWAISLDTVLLLGTNDQILSKVTDCLAPQATKDEVKLYVLNIIRSLVKLAGDFEPLSEDSSIGAKLLNPNMDHFLIEIGGVLRAKQDLDRDLLEACIETILELAAFVSNSSQAHNLVDISIFLLDQPTKRVNPKAKSGLLQILKHFVPLYDLQNDADLKNRVYNTVTSLFGFFKDRASREVLSRVLLVYSQKDPAISEIAEICLDLNSFAKDRLDEPDYDRRLKAFNTANEKREMPFTARQWRPILYNLIFFIRYEEGFSILSANSAEGICTFVNAAGEAQQTNEGPAFMGMISTIVMPALFSGAREPSEVIRREYMKAMAQVIHTFPTWSEVQDMHSLLAGEDEVESSFFNNILTAGKGRQFSALTLVSDAAKRGELSSKNVSHFFIPLIEHFILDRAEGNDAHNLAAEASTTVSVLASSLEWPQYRAVLRRYVGYVQGKPDLEKQIIKLLGKTIDTLAVAVLENSAGQEERNTLARTLPKQKKLAEDISSSILPTLTTYLRRKDESTVSLLVPVAVLVVRLLKLLPEEQLHDRLPAVLIDVCYILRSKAPEARDMARDTLTKICVLLGPSCFGFVLKELRGALARGYQLHVLSYTVHSILVATTPDYAPGDLDYCLPSIVAIIMDDIFGATGQEKDAEEYVSKMKEVKSSKSQDSMELIAKTATLSHLTNLIRPISVLLGEKLNLRMVRKIDELLNRISSGLLRNPAAQNHDILVFCSEIIQDFYKNESPQETKFEDYKLKRYLIQKGAKRGGERGATSIYTYKLVRLAFDILRSVLKKHDSLRTASNLAGFIPILGDAAAQAEEEVRIAAFRLLTTIVRVPMKGNNDWTNLYRIAATEATKCIAGSSTTTSDIAQASLKLISVILRDRQDVLVKDTAVDQLLSRLKDDMTEPERRHMTFTFLRAVMDSKVETATVYDTLDYVGTVMVTNDDKDTRDLARGAYFQFLREYPQQKNRWTKQLSFIVANLKYEREGGRLSILEIIHLLLSKSSQDFVQEVSATCFVPLIFVLANDDSEKCRMVASEVIKEIFKKADKERMKTFLTMLRSWTGQSDNPSVVRLAFQTYGFYYESQESANDADLSILLKSMRKTLETAEQEDSDWEMIYAAVQLAAILCQKFPETLFSPATATTWSAVHTCLSYPHAWVKLSAAKLTSIFFADIARSNVVNSLEGLPLRGSGGLKLRGEDLVVLIRRTTGMLKTPSLSELLAEEIVKNLVFLCRCAEANDLKWRDSKGTTSKDENDENASDEEQVKKTALQYIFGRISYFLRRETTPPRAPALIPKTASLRLFTLLCTKLSVPTLISSLQTIVLPVHNLTDPSISAPYSTDEVFRKNYEALRNGSEELMENVKRKVGTEEYTKALVKIREGVRERRMQRSGKRKIEKVSMPEKYGAEKRRKDERNKDKRREKNEEHRRLRKEYYS